MDNVGGHICMARLYDLAWLFSYNDKQWNTSHRLGKSKYLQKGLSYFFFWQW